MADITTTQIIDISSWDTLYISIMLRSNLNIMNIVTYRPTARQRFDKQLPAETDSW
jgi:hypothetical protein